LSPAGVVVEVAGDERDVDVAGLADGFAVVEGFEDGEAAGVLLDLAGEGVEIAGSLVAGEGLPGGEGFCCCGYGGVDVGGEWLSRWWRGVRLLQGFWCRRWRRRGW